MPNRLLLALARQPAVRRFVTSAPPTRAVVGRFVAGESVDDAVRAARELAAGRTGAILDYLGENVRTEEQADAAAEAYLAVLGRIAAERLDAHISVKLTQLGLDLSFEGAISRLERIAAAAVGRTFVAIDMESHAYTDRTIAAYRRLRDSRENVVLCLQAYLRRTMADAASLLPLEPALRLCKGAYDESDEIALGRAETRISFRELLSVLLPSCRHLAVATHDEWLVEEARRVARRRGLPPGRYEFQMLYGVRRELQARLVAEGEPVRVYVPFGAQWYPYLMRRLAERPANVRLFLEALVRG